MKPYERYKQVDLSWLSKVPEHWNLARTRLIFDAINDRSQTGEEELLSVSSKLGVVKRKNINVTMFKAESYIGYKLCSPRDLVINSLWAWQYGLGFSEYFGIVSTAYSVFRLRKSDDYNYRYFNYLYRGADYHWEMRVRSKGIWKSRYQLQDSSFFNMMTLCPTLDEQTQIVKFLDWKVAKINKYIKAKKRQIELLTELKQAEINRAVTKGLNPDAPMKDSGIDWVGQIPAHWVLRRLKNLFNSNNECLSNNIDSDTRISYLDISTVGCGYLRLPPIEYRFKDAPSRARRIVHEGDIIISTVRTYLKSICYIDKSLSQNIVSTGFAVLSPKEQVNALYMKYTLMSNYLINKVISESVGISYPAINDSRLMSFSVIIPNNQEQQQIIDYLDEKCAEIDRLIRLERQKMDKANEYKTSLISDVVTGKIDVRGIEVPNNIDLVEEDIEDQEDNEVIDE